MTKIIREKENKRMELEIREVRDRKTRIFSYSLAILFSYALAPSAQAAKMCLVAPAQYAYNLGDYAWAVGAGCGDATKTGDPSGWCTTRVASGVAFCARDTGTDDGFQGMESWSTYDPALKGMTGTGTASGPGMARFCFCRMSWPKQGAWVFEHDYGSASGCASTCAYRCANYGVTNATFRSMVLGQPGF